MPAVDPETNNTTGLFADLQKLTSNHPILNNIFTALVGAVTGILAAYAFIDAKVNSAAESRLIPYEQLFSGLSLNQGDEYSAAAREFEKLVASKEFNNLPTKSRSLAYDGLLLAITNSDDVSDFRGSLKKITTIMDESGEETPWRQNQLGWALIRLGELPKSKEHFVKSVNAYKLKKEIISSSDPTRGLLMIALLENNPDEAFSIGQELKKLRPSLYRTNSDLKAEIQESQNTKFFDSFSTLYGNPLVNSIDQYIAKLSKSDTDTKKQ
jgi:hypothetical protein